MYGRKYGNLVSLSHEDSFSVETSLGADGGGKGLAQGPRAGASGFSVDMKEVFTCLSDRLSFLQSSILSWVPRYAFFLNILSRLFICSAVNAVRCLLPTGGDGGGVGVQLAWGDGT